MIQYFLGNFFNVRILILLPLYTFNFRLLDKLMELNDEDLVQLVKDTKDASSVEETKQEQNKVRSGSSSTKDEQSHNGKQQKNLP